MDAAAAAFEFATPTTVIGGVGCGRRAGPFAALFGSRALVVCGNLSAYRSGAMTDVMASLDEAGVAHQLLEGIGTNPGVALVDAGVQLARATGCDVVVAVGGGSVIDVAKAIAVGVELDASVRTMLSGLRGPGDHIASALPVIAVPTLPGSGSELNGTSVLIDESSGRKLSMHGDLATPRVALLDGTYASFAPRSIIVPAIGDALCHAIEAALSRNATIASMSLAREAVLTLVEHAPLALPAGDTRDPDDAAHSLLHCLWAAGLAGQALTMAGSIVTHPLSHPISARLGTHHGVAVSALEPSVIIGLADRWRPGAARTIATWLGPRGLPKTVNDDRTAAHQLALRLTRLNKLLGNTRSLADEGFRMEMIPIIVDDCLASGSRGLANVAGNPLTEADLSQLLATALATAPHRAPSRDRAPQ